MDGLLTCWKKLFLLKEESLKSTSCDLRRVPRTEQNRYDVNSGDYNWVVISTMMGFLHGLMLMMFKEP